MPHRRAIQLLEPFRARVLPGLLRKLLLWKGLDPTRHADLMDDLSQELFLDCIQHGQEIVGLPERERHARWLRLLERCVYRQHIRSERRREPDIPIEHLTAEEANPSQVEADPLGCAGIDLPAPQQEFLRQLHDRASYLKNGRINARRSAQTLGMRDLAFKHAWGEVAANLGFDDATLDFWRHRLVEALVGLAADILRDTREVQVHGEPRRRRPDPDGRVRRIRKLRDAIGSRPLPPDLKTVLARYRRGPVRRSPVQILGDASSLCPTSAAVWLWMFEANLARGAFAAAAGALRAARSNGAEAVPVLLARIRLLQVRGRCAAALWLLARHPQHDPRLQAARRALIA